MTQIIRLRMGPEAPEDSEDSIKDIKSEFKSILGGDTADATVRDYADQISTDREEREVKAYLTSGSLSDSIEALQEWMDDSYVSSEIEKFRPDYETIHSYREEDEEFDTPEHYYTLLYFEQTEDPSEIAEYIFNEEFPDQEWILIESRQNGREFNFGAYRDNPEYIAEGDCITLNPEINVIDWEATLDNIAYRVGDELYKFTEQRFNIDKPEEEDRTDIIVGKAGEVEYLKDTEEPPEDSVLLATIEVKLKKIKGEEVPRYYYSTPEQTAESTSWNIEEERGDVPEQYTE